MPYIFKAMRRDPGSFASPRSCAKMDTEQYVRVCDLYMARSSLYECRRLNSGFVSHVHTISLIATCTRPPSTGKSGASPRWSLAGWAVSLISFLLVFRSLVGRRFLKAQQRPLVAESQRCWLPFSGCWSWEHVLGYTIPSSFCGEEIISRVCAVVGTQIF